MKHIVVGVAASVVVVITFTVWALLGELVGPEWALVVMAFAALCGLGVGLLDYLTEPKEST